jgi:hypothetical protein
MNAAFGLRFLPLFFAFFFAIFYSPRLNDSELVLSRISPVGTAR